MDSRALPNFIIFPTQTSHRDRTIVLGKADLSGLSGSNMFLLWHFSGNQDMLLGKLREKKEKPDIWRHGTGLHYTPLYPTLFDLNLRSGLQLSHMYMVAFRLAAHDRLTAANMWTQTLVGHFTCELLGILALNFASSAIHTVLSSWLQACGLPRLL